MEALSVSFVVGNGGRKNGGNVEHNNRVFIAKNVDPDRIKDNVTYVKQDIRETYEELFSEAIEKNNAKQTRNDRKYNGAKDYYEKILNSKKENPFYEVIVQFGSVENAGIGTENAVIVKEMLDEYMKDFEKRNPNLKVFNAVLHLDEASPHIHIDFVPFAKNQNHGLETRVTFKKALEQQGFIGKSKKFNARMPWEQNETKVMKEILKKHGLSHEFKNVKHKHMSDEEYKEYAREIERLEKLITHSESNQNLTELQQQVSFLKNKLTDTESKLETADMKLSAKPKHFVIPDDDKLSFVKTKLNALNISFVEENLGFSAPEYADEIIKNAEKQYKPQNLTWRERLKLDIDREIYTVNNFSELLQKLKESGYEVKPGKYIAVKPQGAERFIRLKSIGADYTEVMLSKRIANKGNFEKTYNEKNKNGTGIQKEFQDTSRKIIVLFYAKKNFPKHFDKSKPYSMVNDFYLNELFTAVKTLNSNAITSQSDLVNQINALNEKSVNVTSKMAELKETNEVLEDIRQKAELVFEKYGNIEPSHFSEKLKFTAAKETLLEYHIDSITDLKSTDKMFDENTTELENLRKEIAEIETKQQELARINEIYERVHSGSYVNQLVKRELERVEKEKLNERNKEI